MPFTERERNCSHSLSSARERLHIDGRPDLHVHLATVRRCALDSPTVADTGNCGGRLEQFKQQCPRSFAASWRQQIVIVVRSFLYAKWSASLQAFMKAMWGRSVTPSKDNSKPGKSASSRRRGCCAADIQAHVAVCPFRFSGRRNRIFDISERAPACGGNSLAMAPFTNVDIRAPLPQPEVQRTIFWTVVLAF